MTIGADGSAQYPSMTAVTVALDTVTAALDTLRGESASEEALEVVLLRLARTGVAALEDADAISVTRLDERHPVTVAVTDPAMEPIDAAQYAAGRGPCLQACATRRPVRSVVGDHDDVWPEFTAAARAAGIRAYLSVPLLVGDDDAAELVGSFNVYSARPEAFDPFDEKLMALLSTAASAAITNALRWGRSRQTVEQLQAALASRAEIEQAKGVLMGRHGVDAEQAFRELVARSQRTNTKLYDVAREVLRTATAASSPDRVR
ncbi:MULTISPECIES: GAF and ANTAR domain-containing protein [unclassified Rhodococcus (in: high G+C Gram-positive bacteria)]|uniref:GAF and ANTAR domain-containing protein n=1 Tax=unclassified Rhodococcus (in: high G+C Gram-positive bacteria) TaxID=192944 RepID=UPI001BB37A28|nr:MULTISPECIES: GAF and ANTAR domain-containing protein [unclassified Rhodococcus (in: high G+C Gram-positive bacteria)]